MTGFRRGDMVAIEQRLIATSVALARRTTHRVNDRQRLAALDDQRLGEEQQTAYLHVTRSRDLAVVVGIAGGGKSSDARHGATGLAGAGPPGEGGGAVRHRCRGAGRQRRHRRPHDRQLGICSGTRARRCRPLATSW